MDKVNENGHGGARIGAGRKRLPDRDCKVSFGISVRAKDNLERFSKENGISKNEAIVRLLEGLYS